MSILNLTLLLTGWTLLGFALVKAIQEQDPPKITQKSQCYLDIVSERLLGLARHFARRTRARCWATMGTARVPPAMISSVNGRLRERMVSDDLES